MVGSLKLLEPRSRCRIDVKYRAIEYWVASCYITVLSIPLFGLVFCCHFSRASHVTLCFNVFTAGSAIAFVNIINNITLNTGACVLLFVLEFHTITWLGLGAELLRSNSANVIFYGSSKLRLDSRLKDPIYDTQGTTGKLLYRKSSKKQQLFLYTLMWSVLTDFVTAHTLKTVTKC